MNVLACVAAVWAIGRLHGAVHGVVIFLEIAQIDVWVFVEVAVAQTLGRRWFISLLSDRAADAVPEYRAIPQVAVAVTVTVADEAPVAARRFEAVRRAAVLQAGLAGIVLNTDARRPATGRSTPCMCSSVTHRTPGNGPRLTPFRSVALKGRSIPLASCPVNGCGRG